MARIILAPGTDNELVLDETDLTRSNPIRAHTGVSDFRAGVAYNRDVDIYAQRQDRFNLLDDGEVLFTGYLTGASHNERNATTTLIGDGIGKKLEETRPDYDSLGGSLTYQSIAVQDAIRDYWARTPFDNFTVTDQTTELVAEDEEVQSADTTTEWENLFTPASDRPIAISNGNLEITKVCLTNEGENADSTSGIGPDVSDATYSGDGDVNGEGAALRIPQGGWAEFDFTTEHDIEESAVTVSSRVNVPNSEAVDGVEVRIDGDLYYTYGSSSTPYSTGGATLWSDGQSQWSGVLEAGAHTLRYEHTGADGFFDLDVTAPRDSRYPVNLDSTVTTNANGNNYLDGPERFPNVTVELEEQPVSFNISSASVASTWNDTSNNQSVSVSNDGGTTFTTFDNTDSVNHSFTGAGRIAQLKFTLSRYGTQTVTPANGFNGQSIDSFTLTVDGNDLAVIDEIELSRSHFQNAKTLHDAGNFLWVIEHDDGDIAGMTVSSFQEGDETRPAPSSFEDPINKTPEVAGGNYYNSIYLQGALDENGDRPTAELQDDDAVAEDNRVISPGVLRDQKITTDAGTTFRARSLLESAQDNKDLVGSVTVPPEMVHPGFARSIDMGNGPEEKTVEEVSLTESANSVQAQFTFTLPDDLSEEISSLKSESGILGDQL